MGTESSLSILTKKPIHLGTTLAEREGRFLNFIKNFFSQWNAYEKSCRQQVEEGADTLQLGGDETQAIPVDELSGERYIGCDERLAISENFIGSQLNALTKKEIERLIEYCKREREKFTNIALIIDALNKSMPLSKPDYAFWGSDRASFRSAVPIQGFEDSLTLLELLRAKLTAYHQVFLNLILALKTLAPNMIHIETEGNTPDYHKLKGDQVELIKYLALEAAREGMELPGLRNTFAIGQIKPGKQPNWFSLDKKRVILPTIIVGLLMFALVLGLNFVPVIGQALSVVFAMSFVSSLLMTSFVSLAVFGAFTAVMTLTHLSLSARKHYHPPQTYQDWRFKMEARKDYRPMDQPEKTVAEPENTPYQTPSSEDSRETQSIDSQAVTPSESPRDERTSLDCSPN